MLGVQRRMDAIEAAQLADRTMLQAHVADCARRAARLERLAWGLASGVGLLVIHAITTYLHVSVNP